jgi:hypothetical protein
MRRTPVNLVELQAEEEAGDKKTGEYSEEDTHRPAYPYPKVLARRTFGAADRKN